MKEEKVYFTHLKNDFPTARLTIAFRENGSGGIVCGWSWCHEKDQFVKKIGRELAVKKMNSTDCLSVPISLNLKRNIKDKKVSIYQISCSLAVILSTPFYAPSWACLGGVSLCWFK